MAAIHITDIEAAINHWREKKPSPDGITLAPELRALAEVYALMVFHHEDEVDEVGFPAEAWAAWLAWYRGMPDTPCIAICSTSQGDDQCKGCGRSFDEVQHWPAMTPAEKRSTWRRITMEDTAWRFNKYAERAREAEHVWPDADCAGACVGTRRALSPSRAMRRLAQAPNLAIATLWLHALREDGVTASLQREYLGAAAGQLPPDQCLPEIWVDEAEFTLAERLLRELQHRPQRRWHCACGELVEGGFEQCWQCGAMMPAT